MKRLEGKVALITGAARGIGRGLALRMAAEGADIIINDRGNLEEAQITVDKVNELGQRALIWQADVADREDVQGLADDLGGTTRIPGRHQACDPDALADQRDGEVARGGAPGEDDDMGGRLRQALSARRFFVHATAVLPRNTGRR